MDSFVKIVTEDVILQIVRWTNKRFRKTQPEGKETDDVEIRAFIGLLLLLGVWKSNHENLMEIWANDTGRAIFRATMTLHRFQELLSYTRFDDQNSREIRLEADKLAPIRDVS